MLFFKVVFRGRLRSRMSFDFTFISLRVADTLITGIVNEGRAHKGDGRPNNED